MMILNDDSYSEIQKFFTDIYLKKIKKKLHYSNENKFLHYGNEIWWKIMLKRHLNNILFIFNSYYSNEIKIFTFFLHYSNENNTLLHYGNK